MKALYAHINQIVKGLRRVQPVPSSTVRVKETTTGTSQEVIVPPAAEGEGGEPVWLP